VARGLKPTLSSSPLMQQVLPEVVSKPQEEQSEIRQKSSPWFTASRSNQSTQTSTKTKRESQYRTPLQKSGTVKRSQQFLPQASSNTKLEPSQHLTNLTRTVPVSHSRN
jgi:hypothetical protein